MPKKTNATPPKKVVVTLTYPQYIFLTKDAEASLRSPEMQLAWYVQERMNGVVPTAVQKPAVPAVPKVKSWKPLSSYPVLDAEPTGKIAVLRPMGRDGLNGGRMALAVEGAGDVYKVEREFWQAVEGNAALASIGVRPKPLGEWKDWVYYSA